MAAEGGEVRPVRREEDIEAFYDLAAEVFHQGEEDRRQVAWRNRRAAEAAPGFDPRQRRGFFRGGRLIGRCLIHERTLRAGAGRLDTACIDGLATQPEHRGKGVGRALLEDALTFAERRGQALLLLDGIANFYDRFGYARVFDLTEHAIYRPAARELPTEEGAPYRVRAMAVGDAAGVLGLYERHMGPYTGSFVRTPAYQEHLIRQGVERGRLSLVAEAPDEGLAGYLSLGGGPLPGRGREVAADNWPAAAALLREQGRLLDAADADGTAELTWLLPPDAPLLYRLVERLVAVDLSRPGPPSVDASVRSLTHLHRAGGWMARLVSLQRLVEGLLPAWRARLKWAGLGWTGGIVLRVGGEACHLVIEGASVALGRPGGAAELVVLTPQQAVQLAFGYRPFGYLTAQAGAAATQLHPVLEVLFPHRPVFIPAGDWF